MVAVVVDTVTFREVEVIEIVEEDDHEVVVRNAGDTHRGHATSIVHFIKYSRQHINKKNATFACLSYNLLLVRREHVEYFYFKLV